MKSHLTPLNVLDTYAFAEQYGDSQVLYQCLLLIDRHARYILASPTFASLPIRLARDILGRRTLSVKEVKPFIGLKQQSFLPITNSYRYRAFV